MPGLASEYGRDPGSTRRGDAFSAAEKETTRGEACDWPGAGLRRTALEGEETGMPETWLRKAEKEGTAMLASEVCLRDAAEEAAGRRGGGWAEEEE